MKQQKRGIKEKITHASKQAEHPRDGCSTKKKGGRWEAEGRTQESQGKAMI